MWCVVWYVWGVVWTTRGVTTRGVTTWYANKVWCGGMWRMWNVVCGVVCMGCGVDYTWCDYTWCDHVVCQHGVVRRHVEDVGCGVWCGMYGVWCGLHVV